MKKRILVLGAPASGKTTMARKISKALDIPHVEVDKVYWKNGKGSAANPNFSIDFKKLVPADEDWVVEGMIKDSFPFIKDRLTHVFFIKTPVYKLVFRGLMRFFRGGSLRDVSMNLSPYPFYRRKRVYRQLKAEGIADINVRDLLKEKP